MKIDKTDQIKKQEKLLEKAALNQAQSLVSEVSQGADIISQVTIKAPGDDDSTDEEGEEVGKCDDEVEEEEFLSKFIKSHQQAQNDRQAKSKEHS